MICFAEARLFERVLAGFLGRISGAECASCVSWPLVQVVTSSDGKEVELKDGGKSVPVRIDLRSHSATLRHVLSVLSCAVFCCAAQVTFENRQEFVRLAEDYK